LEGEEEEAEEEEDISDEFERRDVSLAVLMFGRSERAR
jgi:hypothetical protein